ncbi:hypothetical protein [Spirochaeta cellobiosiphila]|uniref:hypothetical protein n=1 Tax=Spirochaeta cellobiosiphila TaxID=504483 RepID=UPI0004909E64|nr:hypothetical protein [Spirochaeta cellobiosiphila]
MAEHLTEDVLRKLPHQKFVFTVLKVLRVYFRNNRKLFADMLRWNLLSWNNSGFSIDNSVQILTDKARVNLSEYISRAPVSLKKL